MFENQISVSRFRDYMVCNLPVFNRFFIGYWILIVGRFLSALFYLGTIRFENYDCKSSMARNYRLVTKIQERNRVSRQAEKDDDLEKAIKIYEQNIKEDYADEFAFERLMIIYRKQRDYANELRVINRGIDVFQQNLEEHLKHSLSRHADSKKLEQLSQAIIKKSGLKKQETHFPDPIDKWIKRKEIVQDKLKKNLSTRRRPGRFTE